MADMPGATTTLRRSVLVPHDGIVAPPVRCSESPAVPAADLRADDTRGSVDLTRPIVSL
jgi:hypothetical protein